MVLTAEDLCYLLLRVMILLTSLFNVMFFTHSRTGMEEVKQ